MLNISELQIEYHGLIQINRLIWNYKAKWTKKYKLKYKEYKKDFEIFVYWYNNTVASYQYNSNMLSIWHFNLFHLSSQYSFESGSSPYTMFTSCILFKALFSTDASDLLLSFGGFGEFGGTWVVFSICSDNHEYIWNLKRLTNNS